MRPGAARVHNTPRIIAAKVQYLCKLLFRLESGGHTGLLSRFIDNNDRRTLPGKFLGNDASTQLPHRFDAALSVRRDIYYIIMNGESFLVDKGLCSFSKIN